LIDGVWQEGEISPAFFRERVMSERIKSQSVKNVLPENTKKHILRSIQNTLDIAACVYYFAEILKSPTDYTYDWGYGAHKSGNRTEMFQEIYKAKADLGLNKYLDGAWEKVKTLVKDTGKSDLDDRKFYESHYKSLYKASGGRRSLSVIYFFNEYVRYTTCLIYMFRKSIPPEKLKILEKPITEDMLIDFYHVMELMEEKIKAITWLFKLTKKRNKIEPGDVYYKGKKYSVSQLGRISTNLKKAVIDTIQHSKNMSKYIYNYSSVVDVPIIISPAVQVSSEGGYVPNSYDFIVDIYDITSNNRPKMGGIRLEVNSSFISLTPIVAKRDSVSAIFHVLTHEGTHVWQVSTQRKYPKRWKRFDNSWTRYFNEIKRLGFFKGQQGKVSIQQKEDFMDGLSDYIEVKKLKKYYKLRVLNQKGYYKAPSYEALCNQVIHMMIPSSYSMKNPWELMAETMAFLASGDKSDLGFGVDSDIPSFFVPAKRFLKLVQKYDLDK